MMPAMLKYIVSFAAALALAVPAVALACKGKDGIVKISIEEGKGLYETKRITFVDANGKDTRQKLGTIPGAVMLTSYSEFDAAKELPADKNEKLVFYCANTQCGASHEAAKRAMEAGWVNVGVLPDGIMGWSKAGLPTSKAGAKTEAKASARS